MGHLLIDAALGRPVPRTPIWIMRQAGRYLPEYQAVRSQLSFLELCKSPDRAAEVSLQPVDILGVDAAIIFSDILIPLEGMGMNLVFDEGKGPLLSDPIRSRADVGRLTPYDAIRDNGYLPDAIRVLVRELGGRVPVIGFAGAPYTLACYAVEGKTGKQFARTKAFMLSDPEGFRALLGRLADAVADLLTAQIEAGASMVQLFDTWAGDLAPEQFRAFALPFAVEVIRKVRRPDVPFVYFVNGVAGKLHELQGCGATMLGIDWRIGLDEVRSVYGPTMPLQGNLDPCTLYAPPEAIEEQVARVLAENAGGPHVFNLGHGVLPDIPVAHVKHLVDCVKRLSVRGDS